jgi:pyruvate/2-oxoglutarate/acetoin dehydrogenase E1 component
MTPNQLYNEELKRTMTWLSEQPKTIFLGQAVEYAGTGCYESLTDISPESKMEFPVAENFQIGVSIGLALNGFVPVSVVPRWNFLLCATDQIVNHLDKLSALSGNRCHPKVIIRVAVGSERPIDPQAQHRGNFAAAFRLMCDTVDVVEANTVESIRPSYELAYNRTDGRSTIIVEFSDFGR